MAYPWPTGCLMIFAKGQLAKENTEMKRHLEAFFRDEQGQDLIEYTLLLAFVCMTSAALFIGTGTSVSGIWTAANTQLSAANTSAS